MKSCPACARTYADDSLTFCLADGSLLSASYDPEATQRVRLSRMSPAETEVLPSALQPVRRSNRSSLKLILIALSVLIVGAVGTAVWLNSGARDVTSGPVKLTATASSTRAQTGDVTYHPGNAVDQSLATAWAEGMSGPGGGEWIRVDFNREVKLNRIIITPGYFKTPELWKQNNRLASATFYFSNGTSRRFTFPDRMVEQKLEMGGMHVTWVRMEIAEVYQGSVDAEDTLISNLAFDTE